MYSFCKTEYCSGVRCLYKAQDTGDISFTDVSSPLGRRERVSSWRRYHQPPPVKSLKCQGALYAFLARCQCQLLRARHPSAPLLRSPAAELPLPGRQAVRYCSSAVSRREGAESERRPLPCSPKPTQESAAL